MVARNRAQKRCLKRAGRNCSRPSSNRSGRTRSSFVVVNIHSPAKSRTGVERKAKATRRLAASTRASARRQRQHENASLGFICRNLRQRDDEMTSCASLCSQYVVVPPYSPHFTENPWSALPPHPLSH
jgi:hypothetical protein